MTTPFLSGSTGDPIKLKRQIAFQATRTVPATTGFVDTRTYGGPFALNPSVIDRLAITSGGAPLTPLAGKVLLDGSGPFAMGDVDPGDPGIAKMLANVFGKYTTTASAGTAASSYQRTRYGLDETTAAPRFLTLLNDHDVLPRTRAADILLGGLTIQAAPNDNMRWEFPYVAGSYDFHGVPVETTASGDTVPLFDRTWYGNWEPDGTDAEIYVRIDDASNKAAPSNPSVMISTKVGAAATYDGASYEVFLGRWNQLLDETDDILGDRVAEVPRIYWPVGATLTDLSIWRVPLRRAAWTPSYAVSRAISSINARFLSAETGDPVDDLQVPGGWTLEAAWENLESLPDVYGRQGAVVDRRGNFVVALRPSRRLTDLTWQKALHEAGTVHAVIDAKTDVLIPGTIRRFRALAVCPSCSLSGGMFAAQEGADNRDEEPVMTAGVPDSTFTYDGMAFDSHFTVVLENDIADITA